jgi:hypothetical protein
MNILFIRDIKSVMLGFYLFQIHTEIDSFARSITLTPQPKQFESRRYCRQRPTAKLIHFTTQHHGNQDPGALSLIGVLKGFKSLLIPSFI